MRRSIPAGAPLVSVLLLGLLAAPSSLWAQVLEWTVDGAHSQAQFAVRHMMVSTVRGQLGRISGAVKFDAKDLRTLVVDITIDMAGIDTQEPSRDKHLRGADFFDVEKFPTLTFKSRRAEAAGAGRFRLIGDLTMHGVTKEVTLDVEGPSPEVRQGASARIGATATATLSRNDFGLVWNRTIESGGVAVSDEVAVTIDIEMTRKLPAQSS